MLLAQRKRGIFTMRHRRRETRHRLHTREFPRKLFLSVALLFQQGLKRFDLLLQMCVRWDYIAIGVTVRMNGRAAV